MDCPRDNSWLFCSVSSLLCLGVFIVLVFSLLGEVDHARLFSRPFRGDCSPPFAFLLRQFPYCAQGNLRHWLKAERRQPWELQAAFRQVSSFFPSMCPSKPSQDAVTPRHFVFGDQSRLSLMHDGSTFVIFFSPSPFVVCWFFLSSL